MTDYATQFDTKFSLNSKLSAGFSITDDYGNRQPPLSAGLWDYDNRTRIHHATAIQALNPINGDYRQEDIHDFFAAVHSALTYLQYLVGWFAASPSYQYNGAYYSNFSTFATFEIDAQVSSVKLRLKKNGANPLNSTIYQKGGREDYHEPIDYTDTAGVFPQPGDVLIPGGNSVLQERIHARIIQVQAEASGTTFDVTVDQSVANSTVLADPAGSAPTVSIARNAAKEPDNWTEIPPGVGTFWGRQVVFEYASTDAEWDTVAHVLTLKDTGPGGTDCAIAWPMATREKPPGGTLASNINGTFKFELKTNISTYEDITASLRQYDATQGKYIWAAKTAPVSSSDHKTTIDLSGIIPATVGTVRVTYTIPDADKTAVGVHSPCLSRCGHCRLDRTGTIANVNTTTNGVGTDSRGWHWYCDARATTPALNLNRFRAAECYDMECPNFKIGDRGGPSAGHFAEIFSGMGEALRQLGSGNSSASNFIHLNIRCPSIYWLLTPPPVYSSYFGAWGLNISHYSGGYHQFIGTDADFDGHDNDRMEFSTGAQVNFADNMALLNWSTNRFPSSLFGQLRRRLPSTDAPNMQIFPDGSSAPDATNDPADNDRAWLGGRAPAPVSKLAGQRGEDLYFSTRDIPGLEGENRIQRFNRAIKRIQRDIDSDTESADPTPNAEYFEKFPASKTIGSHSSIDAVFQVRRDGTLDPGRKRVGESGLNARGYRVESLGAGLYKIHCYLGLYFSHTTATQTDIIDTFWACGNVVDLPWPYKFEASIYQATRLGTARRKATVGDVVDFPSLGSDAKFWVTAAEPAAGDDLSAVSGDEWVDQKTIGKYFDFSPWQSTGGEIIDITRVQIQFVSGSFQDHFTLANPARKFTRWEDRPQENAQAAGDLSLAFLDQDRFEAPNPAGSPINIVGITDGGAPNHPPEVQTSAPHGLPTATNESVIITESDSTPKIDGNWVAIVTGADTFVLGTVEYKSDPITSPGAAGKVYRVSADMFVQGTFAAFPSYNCHQIAYSTGAGLLNPNIRLDFLINGANPQTVDLALELPTLNPTFTADISRVADWTVEFEDPRFLGRQALNYGGIISNNYDITTAGASFFTWHFNPTTGEMVFHPNLAGARIIARYFSTTTQSFGDSPSGVSANTVAATETMRTKADILTIRDEMGIIDTLGENALENVDFYIRTGGVLLPPDLSGRAVVLKHRTAGDTPGAWSTLVNGSDYQVHYARGRLYVHDTAAATITGARDIEATGDISNAAPETPAQLCQNIVRCLDALDTVKTNLSLGKYATFGVATESFLPVGTVPRTDPHDPAGVLCNSPLVLGSPAPYLKAWTDLGGDTVNNLDNTGTCGIADWKYVTATNPPGRALSVGCSQVFVPGIGVTGLTAFYIGDVYSVDLPDFLKKLPPDSEIVSAKMTVKFGENTGFFREIRHSVSRQLGALGYAGLDSTYTPPADTPRELIATPLITWSLFGQKPDGYWVNLGSAAESQTVGIVPGKSRVLDATALVALLLGVKAAAYKKIAMVPSKVETGAVSETVSSVGQVDKHLINTAVESFAEFTVQHTYQDPSNSYYSYYWELETFDFIVDTLEISELMVEFKLPGGVIQQRPIYGGNWPHLDPIT